MPPMANKPKVALITGVTGQDGAYLAEFLLAKGYDPHGEFRWVEDREGRHHESAWGRRFRKALPFLLRNGGSR